MSKRNIGLDMLNSIAMFMVLVLHFLLNCGLLDNNLAFSSVFYESWLLEAFCYGAVNCFVLITGYFMWDKRFRPSQILSLYITVTFYSMIILLILILDRQQISKMDIIQCVFPFSTGHYWYLTTYVLLYLFVPFLNRLISVLNEVLHKKLVIAMIILFSVIPTMVCWQDSFVLNAGQSVAWFIFLYILGSYYAKYKNLIIKIDSSKKWMCIFIVVSVLIYASKMIISVFTMKLLGRIEGSAVLFKYNSFAVLFASIALFKALLYIDCERMGRPSENYDSLTSRFSDGCVGGVFSKIRPYTLAVYVLTENNMVRDRLWNFVVNIVNLDNFVWPIMMLLILFAIYFSCILVDYIRGKLFTKIGINKAYSYVDKKLCKLF